MSCDICGPAETITETLGKAFELAYSVGAPFVTEVLAGVATVYLAFRTVQLIAGDESADLRTLGLEMLWIGLVAAAVRAGALIWEPLFAFFHGAGPYLAVSLAEAMGVSVSGSGFLGFFEVFEDTVFHHVWDAFAAAWSDVSLWNIDFVAIVSLGLLMLIYLYFFWLVIKTALAQMLTIYGVGLLGPFVLAFAAFATTRPITIHALKVLMSAGLQLMISTTALAIMLATFGDWGGFAEGDGVLELREVGSDAYLEALFVGVLVVLLYETLVSVPAMLLQTFGEGVSKRPGALAAAAGGVGAAVSGLGSVGGMGAAVRAVKS